MLQRAPSFAQSFSYYPPLSVVNLGVNKPIVILSYPLEQLGLIYCRTQRFSHHPARKDDTRVPDLRRCVVVMFSPVASNYWHYYLDSQPIPFNVIDDNVIEYIPNVYTIRGNVMISLNGDAISEHQPLNGNLQIHRQVTVIKEIIAYLSPKSGSQHGHIFLPFVPYAPPS